jgi:hypothetical protein
MVHSRISTLAIPAFPHYMFSETTYRDYMVLMLLYASHFSRNFFTLTNLLLLQAQRERALHAGVGGERVAPLLLRHESWESDYRACGLGAYALP